MFAAPAAPRLAYGTEISRSGKWVVIANGTGGSTTITLDEFEARATQAPQAPTQPTQVPVNVRRPLEPASPECKAVLRQMLADRAGRRVAEAIREEMNVAREAGPITAVLVERKIAALSKVPLASAPVAAAAGASVSKPVSQATEVTEGPIFVAPEVHPGVYTLEKGGGHRTFRVVLQDRDATFAAGQTILQYLAGPDNTADYVGFGFVKGGRLIPWKKHAGNQGLMDDAKTFLADPEALLKEKHCLRCHAPLTVPASILRGLGPTCATKGF